MNELSGLHNLLQDICFLMKPKYLQFRAEHSLFGLTRAICMDFSSICTPNLEKIFLELLDIILYKNDPKYDTF